MSILFGSFASSIVLRLAGVVTHLVIRLQSVDLLLAVLEIRPVLVLLWLSIGNDLAEIQRVVTEPVVLLDGLVQDLLLL